MARNASSSVIGSRVTIVCPTGSCRESVPRSPRNDCAIQLTYWTGSGLSSPYVVPDRGHHRRVAVLAAERERRVTRQRADADEDDMLAREQTTIRAAPALRSRKPPMTVGSPRPYFV